MKEVLYVIESLETLLCEDDLDRAAILEWVAEDVKKLKRGLGIPITLLDLALHRGAKENESGSITGDAIEAVGLPFMGGCECCGACIGAHNGCPSKTGNIRCLNGCIGDQGYLTAEEANADLFPDG